jgi:hypothetical protein
LRERIGCTDSDQQDVHRLLERERYIRGVLFSPGSWRES